MSTSTFVLPEIASLSLEQKVAQLIHVDVPGLELDAETIAHLEQHAFHGVILFAHNVLDREQVVRLVDKIHDTLAIVPWISIDQEGGLVDRVRFPEMSLSPGLMALGATDDPARVEAAHRIMGRELADLGVHIDFAPCLDVNVNPHNPIIGARSLGENPERVGELGRAAIRGLRQGGVAACAKHFPGHGDTSMDSHMALPTVAHPRERLEQVELAPFRAAVAEEVEAMMTAHIVFPAYDSLPATLSKTILTDLLRKEMGYQGVIVTDSLSMKAIADHYGMGEATVRSVEAGADLVLALGPIADQRAAFQALLEAARSGRISEGRLDESLERLFALKRRFHNRPNLKPGFDQVAHAREMREIAAAGVTVVRNEDLLPLRPGKVLVLTPDLLPLTPLGEMATSTSLATFMHAHQGEVMDQKFHFSGISGPAHHEVVARAAEADTVVLALYARNRLSDPQRELAEAVLAANPRTVLVSLSSPYLLLDLPQAQACVLGYNYTPLTLEAVAEVLLGKRSATGRLPVALPGLYPAGHRAV